MGRIGEGGGGRIFQGVNNGTKVRNFLGHRQVLDPENCTAAAPSDCVEQSGVWAFMHRSHHEMAATSCRTQSEFCGVSVTLSNSARYDGAEHHPPRHDSGARRMKV